MNAQVTQIHEPSQCPSCGSEEWKLASLIRAEGTTHAQSLTAGGVASGIDDGVPIGMGFTQKTERSKLAELAAPPSRQTVKWQRISIKSNRAMATGIIVGVLAMVTIILTEAQSGILNSIIFPALIYSMYKTMQSLYLHFIGPEAAENRKRKDRRRSTVSVSTGSLPTHSMLLEVWALLCSCYNGIA